MASVSSLDHDMRKLRLDRYTPQAADEVRAWIEATLGERLASGDLMEALKDGVALLINLAVSPGVKYKASSMPFVQMENISHFLKACEMPPLNLPSHDRFLTVDLYDSKDPTQVLQCIAAFSRRANTVNPGQFPRTLGAKTKGSAMSPQLSGSSQGGYSRSPDPPSRERALSNTNSTTTFNPLAKAAYSGRISPTKSGSLARGGLASPGPVSSWSKKGDEGNTAPAWNIHQYGYMGGASQGNQGVAFGARRQITSAGPNVPSLAEKERRRREEAAETERQKLEAEQDEMRRRTERQAEEEHARAEEEQRWREETRRLREKERQAAEEEKRRWAEEQRKWKEEEESSQKEERELEARLTAERSLNRGNSDARLNGQFLSQYHAGQPQNAMPVADSKSASEAKRIVDLERQLEEAKERERQYERERQARLHDQPYRQDTVSPQPVSTPAPPARPTTQVSHHDDWDVSEREYLQTEWQKNQDDTHLPTPPKPPRPTPAEPVAEAKPALPARPLPDPSIYTAGTNRTDHYLTSNPAPPATKPASHRPSDYSTTTEVDLENERRQALQAKTKAGGWASKSLLEREMERERERQREWEESQKQTAATTRDQREGIGPGQTWDVHQYGFVGGDSQNRGGPGLGIGGARRQIIGPRPPP